MNKVAVLKLIGGLKVDRGFLMCDPITSDCTDWEFSHSNEKAKRYSTNQAIHLQRYFALMKGPDGLSLQITYAESTTVHEDTLTAVAHMMRKIK